MERACRPEGSVLRRLADRIDALVERNRRLYDVECVNLNPATSTLSPRAAAALDPGLSNRPSLGYPGDKYETGLEAIETIEIVAAELAALVFDADFAEVRVPSGAIANLYAFMATCRPGDAIIVPPATIAGHVTHHTPGAAGLYGLDVHEAPIDATRYTVDVDGVAALAERVRPRLITIGGSLNLTHHDVARSVGRRSRARRTAAVRRRTPVGTDRRRCVAEPARRRCRPDDDEHLQEPRRPCRRAARDQRRRARRTRRPDRVPGADRQLRRRHDRGARDHPRRVARRRTAPGQR